MRDRLRASLRRNPALETASLRLRALPLELGHARSMKGARAEAERRRLSYSEASTRALLRERLGSKRVQAKAAGSLRIFAAWVEGGWETRSLIPALAELGSVTVVEVGRLSAVQGRPDTTERARIQTELLARFRAALSDGGVDVVFTYLSAHQIDPETLDGFAAEGVPVVNMSLDDDINFASLAPIAEHVDLCWTCFSDVPVRYLLEGAVPLWLPAGADPVSMRPLGLERDIPVSFVGARYGMRPIYVHALRRLDIDVRTFGRMWGSGPVSDHEMNEIFNRSKVNLGFAGRMFSERIVGLKMRDFEIPMAGGLYVTGYVPDLEACYEIGEEIVCYRSRDELVEQIEGLLSNERRADEIRAAGHARARKDHTWLARFEKVFEMVGVLEGSA